MIPNILIVDDDPSARRTLRAFLLKQDYTLHFAASGPDALAMLQDVTPDVILLDVMMPGPNGFAVCRQIKANEPWRHIPVILVTALDGKDDVVCGLEAGADDFLAKPVDKLELRARIRSMLRIKHQYDQLIAQQQQLTEALQLNRKLGQVIAQHLEELELLQELGLRLMDELNTDSVLDLVFKAALELIPEATGCTIHLSSDLNQALLPIVYSVAEKAKLIQPAVGIEEFVKQVVDAQQSIYLPDLLTETPPSNPQYENIRSLLVTPLPANYDLVGTISVYGPEADIFTERDRHILSILANQTIAALTRARFFESQDRKNGQEKRTIQDLFQRYVDPTVVDRLVSGREQPTLGGKRQEVSVLFADLRGFTFFGERMPPECLVEMLNHYLGLAVEPILEQGGTLDKFIGDAVMAVFNAPLVQPDHALRAVRAALTIQQAIADYNFQNRDHPPLSFGIGINTGQAVVGNIGTAQNMNYTAIGDAINVAWRLQQHAKAGQILLSQAARAALKNVVIAEALGRLQFKGRQAIEPVYELTGIVDEVSMRPNNSMLEIAEYLK